jgi:hypothetical protein
MDFADIGIKKGVRWQQEQRRAYQMMTITATVTTMTTATTVPAMAATGVLGVSEP